MPHLPVEKDSGRWRSLEVTAPDGRAIKATTPNGWGRASWECLARGDFPKGYVVRALDPVDLAAGAADAEQAAITQEAVDLKEAFEERAAILEFDGGLPKAQAELEGARIVATLARNRGYLWASLRSALSDYSDLLAQVPDRPGTVDILPLGVATVHVRKDGRVLREGEFSGRQEAKAG